MIHRDATAQTTMAPKTAQAASFALRCACACCRAFVLSPALSLVAFAAVAGITAADISTGTSQPNTAAGFQREAQREAADASN